MKTCVVTGANRGIGLELCIQFLARRYGVYGVCRKASSALRASGAKIIDGVDVADDRQVAELGKRFEGVKVDVLVNNAGILTRETLSDFNIERIRKQFEVNSIGPLRVTVALLPNLKQGSKIAIITSRMGSIGDNTSGERYGYRMSKAAVNIAGVSLSHDLKDRGIMVGIIHPGYVRTGMTDNNGLIDPPESVRGIMARIDELTLENSGSFWHENGELLPW